MKAWARVDAFAPKHSKTIELSSDAVRWTWVVMLCDGKLQKPQGQWVSLRHLAGSTGRPIGHLKELIAVRLIDEDPSTGALTAHNWDLWQSASHDDPTKQERQRRYREARREELAEEQRSRRRARGDGGERRRGDGVATDHSDGQTETETETETEKNTLRASLACPELPADADRSGPPDPPDDPAVAEGFPCVGPVRTWSLRRSLAQRLAEAYPHLDVPAEAQRAKAWLFANAERRKTARGMPRFLNSWLARTQDSTRGAPPARTPQPVSAGAHTLNAAREAMRRKGLLDDEPGRNQSPLRPDLEVGPGVPIDPAGA